MTRETFVYLISALIVGYFVYLMATGTRETETPEPVKLADTISPIGTDTSDLDPVAYADFLDQVDSLHDMLQGVARRSPQRLDQIKDGFSKLERDLQTDIKAMSNDHAAMNLLMSLSFINAMFETASRGRTSEYEEAEEGYQDAMEQDEFGPELEALVAGTL